MCRIDEIKRRLKDKFFRYCAVWECEEDIEFLLNENEKLKTALSFYADEKNWNYQGYYDLSYTKVVEDHGDQAREALRDE